MGDRRRPTLGQRAAQPDPIRTISYNGLPQQPQRDGATDWLRTPRSPKRCSCGMELPVTGKCDYCDYRDPAATSHGFRKAGCSTESLGVPLLRVRVGS